MKPYRNEHTAPSYLTGLLGSGARPYTYRGGVYRLLGVPVKQEAPMSFRPPLPPVGFNYAHHPRWQNDAMRSAPDRLSTLPGMPSQSPSRPLLGLPEYTGPLSGPEVSNLGVIPGLHAGHMSRPQDIDSVSVQPVEPIAPLRREHISLDYEDVASEGASQRISPEVPGQPGATSIGKREKNDAPASNISADNHSEIDFTPGPGLPTPQKKVRINKSAEIQIGKPSGKDKQDRRALDEVPNINLSIPGATDRKALVAALTSQMVTRNNVPPTDVSSNKK